MNSFRIRSIYRRWLPMMLLLFWSTFMYAQGGLVTIKGKVVDGSSNEARINAGGNYDKNPEFSSWIGNPNFNYRPNNTNGRWDFFESTNWVDEGTRDYTTQQNHTVAISGDTKSINYMLSAKWYTKNGILKYGPDSNERWSLNC